MTYNPPPSPTTILHLSSFLLKKSLRYYTIQFNDQPSGKHQGQYISYEEDLYES